MVQEPFLGLPSEIENANTAPHAGGDLHEDDSLPSAASCSPADHREARESLSTLMAGNKRFCRGEGFRRCRPDLRLLVELRDEQRPSAVVLGCSDSRIPPELVFDQGLGDVFVVRVAGHVVNDFVLGSMLNAVQLMGTRLVVVLGHSRCFMVARAVHFWAQQRSRAEGSAKGRQGTPPPGVSTPFSQTSGEASDAGASNPMVAMMADVVESVEALAERNAGKLKHLTELVQLNARGRRRGSVGLHASNSMELTRARMAQAQAEERQRQIGEITLMQGIEDVIDENTIRSAKAVLTGLARHVDAGIMEEVQVVAAKYDLDSGQVEVKMRMWMEDRNVVYE